MKFKGYGGLPFQMTRRVLHCILLGAPASGKGTISTWLMNKYGFIHIAPGNILRRNLLEGNTLGMKAKAYMDAGQLVPDELVLQSVFTRINEVDSKSWLLDGFPRNRQQAENLDKQNYRIDSVINLDVPHSEIISRVKTRWVHLKSGRVYSIGFKEPKVPGKDDITGEPLVQRADDKPEILAQRLKVYDSTILPVIEFYEQKNVLKTFKCKSSCEVWPRIMSYLDKKLTEPSTESLPEKSIK